MKGQGESIIEDDDKGEDPDVVTDNPGEILFHYETNYLTMKPHYKSAY